MKVFALPPALAGGSKELKRFWLQPEHSLKPMPFQQTLSTM
jgi:hypothetical protein